MIFPSDNMQYQYINKQINKYIKTNIWLLFIEQNIQILYTIYHYQQKKYKYHYQYINTYTKIFTFIHIIYLLTKNINIYKYIINIGEENTATDFFKEQEELRDIRYFFI